MPQLNQNTLQVLFETQDLQEYIDTAVDPSYTGFCILRPLLADSFDSTLRELYEGKTIFKFSKKRGETDYFSIIKSDRSLYMNTCDIPMQYMQKADLGDLRPWVTNQLVYTPERIGVTKHLIVDYTGKGEVAIQNLETGEVTLRNLEDIYAITRKDTKVDIIKGFCAARLTKDQAFELGFPEGTVLPFLDIHFSIGSSPLCRFVGTDKMFEFKDIDFVYSTIYQEILKQAGLALD